MGMAEYTCHLSYKGILSRRILVQADPRKNEIPSQKRTKAKTAAVCFKW
jgi:hypothetical protein